MRWMAIAAAASILAACTTTSGLDAREQQSGFSGGRIVSISPHGAICPMATLGVGCASVGAYWDSTRPDRAQLVVMLLDERYKSITGLDLNIDGRITRLEPSSLPTTSERIPGGTVLQSSRHFPTTLAMVRDVRSAKRVWLRIHTLEGYLESAVIDGPEDSKAYHALGRFLARVDNGASR